MSLYDNFQQSQNPYMSQFVGSIVPEVQQYSQLVQGRYNQAADSDDALGEALGNMGHLNFDVDTQYANELKSKTYQGLQERAASGDFENMGRRTRQDAIKFSQAYQPLLQRQKDYAEIVKKVNNDDSISDPNKKAEILRYIQKMNSSDRDPSSGDFVRDASGRIQLGGIQDWAYAPDVDINKKVVDLLSKKEADINAGRYFKDGNGNLINTIVKLRDPRYMAQLANEMMKTDPEIKAMINRDVTLKTYALTPAEVKANLKAYGLDKSPYQELRKGKGLNKHEAQAVLGADGKDLNKAQISQLDVLKSQYPGMSDEAAERAILNAQVAQEIRNGHAGLAGGILGYRQESNDHMTDHMAVIRATAAAEALKDPNAIVFQGNTSTTSQENPEETAKNYTGTKVDLQATAANGTTAILAALKATGMSTGNVKSDATKAIELLHNPVKLNALKLELAKTHPQEAQVLETVAQSYKDKAAIAEVQAQHVDDIEKAGGMDWNKEYNRYKSTHQPFLWMNKKQPTLDEFKDLVRSGDASIGAQRMNYSEVVKNGQKSMLDGKSQGAGYHPIVATGPGKVDRLTNAVNNLALTSGISGVDLNDPKSGPVDIVKALGIDRTKYADKDVQEAMKHFNVQVNTEAVGDKPTLTVTGPDGTTKIFAAQNLPTNIQDEINYEVHRAGAVASTSSYGQKLMKQGLAGMGSTEFSDITPQYIKTINPGASGVVKKLNENFSTRIYDAGGGVRKYILLTNNADGTHSNTGYTFDSVDDLFKAGGKYREKNITSQTDQKILNTQR